MRFSEFFLDDGFQIYLNRQKIFSKLSKSSQKYCRNWCHFYVFITISRYTAWLEDSEAVAPRASMKNLFLNLGTLKVKVNSLCHGLIFNKVAGSEPATSSNRDTSTGAFLKKLLRRPFHKHLGMTASEEQDLWLESLFVIPQVFTVSRIICFNSLVSVITMC